MASTYVRRFKPKESAKRSRSCFVLEDSAERVRARDPEPACCCNNPASRYSQRRAAELAPMVGLEKNFRTGASALIYYTEGVDGDHVVTTVQSDDTRSMKIFRFISILAPGQTAEISVPHELGQTADTIVIRRVGNRLLVEDDVEIASTK